jgi:hypothetical protein
VLLVAEECYGVSFGKKASTVGVVTWQDTLKLLKDRSVNTCVRKTGTSAIHARARPSSADTEQGQSREVSHLPDQYATSRGAPLCQNVTRRASARASDFIHFLPLLYSIKSKEFSN